MKRSALISVIILAALAISNTAAAEGFDLQQFHPAPNLEENFFTAQSGAVVPHLEMSGFLLFNYANAPLVRRNDQGERVESIVAYQGTTHLMFSVGLLDRLELGLDIPLIVLQDGTNVPGAVNPEEGGYGIGDIRLVPKVQLYTNRAEAGDQGLGLALVLDTHLPTGDGAALQGGDFRIGPRLAFDYDFGGPRVGANLGYLYRGAQELQNLEVRDTMSWSVGAEMPVHDMVALTGEFFGRLTPGATEIRRTESPTEFVAGAKVNLGDFRIVAGGGAGLVNGYGTPNFRGFLGFGWAPRAEPAPEPEPEPEPAPEPDCRAASVVADCPDVPETTCEDGVLRRYAAACEDGECSYPLTETRCATGTICGEEDGEPACVPAPACEEDGDCTSLPQPTCEEGVLTTYAGLCVDGNCEYEPTETTCEEGYECGLSGGVPACVEVTDLVEIDEETERIEISEVVYFATNSDEIEERSFRLLNQVAQVLENHPEITAVRVEGHTDNRGSRDHNLDLSRRRAESVRTYLIERGIEADRLTAVGLGPDRPVTVNTTEAGRSANRRVEFHIEERD